VEAPLKYKFDTRWLCTRTHHANPLTAPFDDAGSKPRLSLVPVEPSCADTELEEAGTQRLLEAMAAVHPAEAQTRRSSWL
jgi:hypothetical protein